MVNIYYGPAARLNYLQHISYYMQYHCPWQWHLFSWSFPRTRSSCVVRLKQASRPDTTRPVWCHKWQHTSILSTPISVHSSANVRDMILRHETMPCVHFFLLSCQESHLFSCCFFMTAHITSAVSSNTHVGTRQWSVEQWVHLGWWNIFSLDVAFLLIRTMGTACVLATDLGVHIMFYGRNGFWHGTKKLSSVFTNTAPWKNTRRLLFESSSRATTTCSTQCWSHDTIYF